MEKSFHSKKRKQLSSRNRLAVIEEKLSLFNRSFVSKRGYGVPRLFSSFICILRSRSSEGLESHSEQYLEDFFPEGISKSTNLVSFDNIIAMPACRKRPRDCLISGVYEHPPFCIFRQRNRSSTQSFLIPEIILSLF